MLSVRRCRPLTKKLIRYSTQSCLTVPLYDPRAKSFKTRFHSTRLPRQASTRRNKSPQDQNAIDLYPKDSAEVTALKTRIVNEIHNPRIDLDAVAEISTSYQSLVEAQTIFSRALTRQLIDWVCRASLFANGLTTTNASLTQDLVFQQKKSLLQFLIDDIVAKYKQGRFQTDGDVPATILFHYQNTGESDKALTLWNWLDRMREPGHLNYRGYAARIAIAERLGEGAEECENLYLEAMDKFGDSLVNYHISNNAVLSDSNRPVERQVTEVIPLLRSMFSVKLRNGDWRNAYLMLDTILRIDPRSLWGRAKFDILSTQSSWEAFLVESAESSSGIRKELKQSVASEWLDRLLPESLRCVEGNDIKPARVYSIACTILASLYRAHAVENVVDQSEESSRKKLDCMELEVLWKCWMKLYYWHGKDDTIDVLKDGTGAYYLVNFIKTILQQRQYQKTSQFQLRMKKNFKLSQKQDGIPALRGISASLLLNLRERIGLFQAPHDEQGLSTLQDIPHWSCLLGRKDMLELYQELDPRSSTTDQPKEEVVSDSNEDHQSSPPSEKDHPELIYETRSGLQFGEARFQHWVMINNMFLVADEFERNGCLHWQSMADELESGIATKQATVLEQLNGAGLSAEDKEIKKQVLLDRLRLFRRYVGDSNI